MRTAKDTHSAGAAALKRSGPATRGRAVLQGRALNDQEGKERPKRSISLAWSGSEVCDGLSPSNTECVRTGRCFAQGPE